MTNTNIPEAKSELAADTEASIVPPEIDVETERAALAELFGHFNAPDDDDAETVIEMVALAEFVIPAPVPVDAPETPKEV